MPLIPLSGPISMSMLNTAVARSATTTDSLLANGETPANPGLFYLGYQINNALNQTAPHAISEWYGFDSTTTTTTTTSTTTTTTTAPTFYDHRRSNTGNATECNVCPPSYGASLFYTSPGDNIPTIGMTVYTDSSLTTPFNGGNLWWAIEWDGPSSSTVDGILIGTDGIVDDTHICSVDCPTTTTTTSTTTTTTTSTPFVYAATGSSQTEVCNATQNVVIYYTGTGENICYWEDSGTSIAVSADYIAIGSTVYQLIAGCRDNAGSSCDAYTTTTTSTTTTTTTVCAGTYYEYLLSTETESEGTACTLSATTTVYSSESDISLVGELYTTCQLTTLVTGNGGWFKLKSGATEYRVSINGLGVVSGNTDCNATTTTTTSTTTTTTTAAPTTTTTTTTSTTTTTTTIPPLTITNGAVTCVSNDGQFTSTFSGGSGTYVAVAYDTSQANAADLVADGVGGSGQGFYTTMIMGSSYQFTGVPDRNGLQYWYTAVRDSNGTVSVQSTGIQVSCDATTTTTTTTSTTTTTTTVLNFQYTMTRCDIGGSYTWILANALNDELAVYTDVDPSGAGAGTRACYTVVSNDGTTSSPVNKTAYVVSGGCSDSVCIL